MTLVPLSSKTFSNAARARSSLCRLFTAHSYPSEIPRAYIHTHTHYIHAPASLSLYTSASARGNGVQRAGAAAWRKRAFYPRALKAYLCRARSSYYREAFRRQREIRRVKERERENKEREREEGERITAPAFPPSLLFLHSCRILWRLLTTAPHARASGEVYVRKKSSMCMCVLRVCVWG